MGRVGFVFVELWSNRKHRGSVRLGGVCASVCVRVCSFNVLVVLMEAFKNQSAHRSTLVQWSTGMHAIQRSWNMAHWSCPPVLSGSATVQI